MDETQEANDNYISGRSTDIFFFVFVYQEIESIKSSKNRQASINAKRLMNFILIAYPKESG